MSVKQRSYFCPNCQQQRLFTQQQGVNHILHLLIMLFSCGLWAFVWGILILSNNPRFHCSQCGATPQFQKVAKQPSAIAKWFHSLVNAFKATAIGTWFFSLNKVLQVILGILSVYTGILVVAFVVGAFLGLINRVTNQITEPQMIANSTPNSSSNTATASETTIVYQPRGLSPAENLEKGKKAISDGDRRTAIRHLSAIPKAAKEFASAKQLLANFSEREQINVELEELREQHSNLERRMSGLAFKIDPPDLAKEVDRLEKVRLKNEARQEELELKLKTIP